MIIGITTEELSNDTDKISKLFFEEEDCDKETCTLKLETESKIEKNLVVKTKDLEILIGIMTEFIKNINK